MCSQSGAWREWVISKVELNCSFVSLVLLGVTFPRTPSLYGSWFQLNRRNLCLIWEVEAEPVHVSSPHSHTGLQASSRLLNHPADSYSPFEKQLLVYYQTPKGTKQQPWTTKSPCDLRCPALKECCVTCQAKHQICTVASHPQWKVACTVSAQANSEGTSYMSKHTQSLYPCCTTSPLSLNLHLLSSQKVLCGQLPMKIKIQVWITAGSAKYIRAT